MDALIELEQTLRSKQGGLTPPEASILQSCRSMAVNSFAIGACAASALVWAVATGRMNKMFQFNLSAGSAVSFGLWRFSRSLDSCLDDIMALDGSRMQKELATIIVNKYQDNPWRMQLISNHFYSERVFDDSTSDKPKLRWRHRNFFGDSASHSQGTHDDPVIDSQNDNHSYKNDLESKQVHVKPGVDMMSDPLDCLLEAAAGGEIHPDPTNIPQRIHTRSHKRSHRRRRMRHQEASSELSEGH